ncbi:hypothetical protein CWATWH0402_2182 [Crocosphaera watsonii WH 0402]|uniref:Uncharacterized protein n=1 Tax=Crocosphaera watsonii WH 0402 TaxID=1284629 RepID=T2JNQ6_CROWT|nr:hypothetical protein CWATWH0402_2182 [Crocosphaera watsonii WH 0402]
MFLGITLGCLSTTGFGKFILRMPLFLSKTRSLRHSVDTIGHIHLNTPPYSCLEVSLC